MITKLQDVTIQSDLDRLVLLIRHLGMKQYEFAREIGYNPAYLESVINRRVPFTDSCQQRIDSYLEKCQKERYIYAEKMLNLSCEENNRTEY